jgi:purine-binding chemotaxis protein CheW
MIDWARLHERLNASEAALARRLNPDRETQRAMLRERARGLARETRADQAPLESIEVVEFILAHERYAIESQRIREIYPLREFTSIPGAPRFVLGLINVRGQILSVIDIRKFFDLPEKGLTDLNKVIILQTPYMELGIVADAIIGMRSVPVRDMAGPLPTLTGIRAEYLKGVTQEAITVLDAAKLLSDSRIVVKEGIEPSA